jgi:hypothetical protein
MEAKIEASFVELEQNNVELEHIFGRFESNINEKSP